MVCVRVRRLSASEEKTSKTKWVLTTKPDQMFEVCPFFVDFFMIAVLRQRHWISTEVAIDSLKQRDRPLKSKYLKDAYELQTRAAADQGGSEAVMASNGHTKRVENGDTRISSDSRDGTNSETLCAAYHDGGCLRNSV